MYCPKCGTHNADNADACVSCGQSLSASTARARVQVKTSGLAIAAFVLGVLSPFTLGLTGIPAIIVGIIALVMIGSAAGRLTGRAFAIIGIVLPLFSFFVLLGLLMPALAKTRERARYAVCMSNVRNLSLAWFMYADDNDDTIVNGAAGGDRVLEGVGVEKAWTGKGWADRYKTGEQLSRPEQEAAVRNGVLFPYFADIAYCRCPLGLAGQLRTYAIVDAMNGTPREAAQNAGLYVKKRSRISNPSGRVVYIDQGWTAPGSFPVHSDKALWACEPPRPHRDATSVSFADGHAESWRWTASETLKIARRPRIGPYAEDIAPQTREGRNELAKFQAAVWGHVRYTTDR
jgi:prepilin-type processing-associated H-X9-DG protein